MYQHKNDQQDEKQKQDNSTASQSPTIGSWLSAPDIEQQTQAINFIKNAKIGQLTLDPKIYGVSPYKNGLLKEYIHKVKSIIRNSDETILFRIDDPNVLLKIHLEHDPPAKIIKMYKEMQKTYNEHKDLIMEIKGYQIIRSEQPLIYGISPVIPYSMNGYYMYVVEIMQVMPYTEREWTAKQKIINLNRMQYLLARNNICHGDLHIFNVAKDRNQRLKVIDTQSIRKGIQDPNDPDPERRNIKYDNCLEHEQLFARMSSIEICVMFLYKKYLNNKTNPQFMDRYSKFTDDEQDIFRRITSSASVGIYGQQMQYEYFDLLNNQTFKMFAQKQISDLYGMKEDINFTRGAFNNPTDEIKNGWLRDRYLSLDDPIKMVIILLLVFAELFDGSNMYWLEFVTTLLRGVIVLALEKTNQFDKLFDEKYYQYDKIHQQLYEGETTIDTTWQKENGTQAELHQLKRNRNLEYQNKLQQQLNQLTAQYTQFKQESADIDLINAAREEYFQKKRQLRTQLEALKQELQQLPDE